MNTDILENIVDEVLPVRLLAEKLLKTDPEYSYTQDALHISKRPHIGSEAYALILYRGIDKKSIDNCLIKDSIKIPDIYKKILLKMNGAFIYRISLFGISPLVNRTTLNPHDISIANKFWKNDYKHARDYFHFGVGPWTDVEDVGYFLNHKGLVNALLKSGKRVKEWYSFNDFFADEIERAEKLYPDFEKLIARARGGRVGAVGDVHK